MISDSADRLWPLADIQQKLTERGIEVSLSQLEEWADRHQKREGGLGFPEPVKLGKYKLYDIDKVEEWIILWRRATARVGNPKGLNHRGKR